MHPHCIFGHIFNFAKDKSNGKREEVCSIVKRYRVCIILLQKLYSLKLYFLVGLFSLITLTGKRNVEGYSV